MSEILAEMERTREAARLGVPIICILSRDVTAGTGDYYHVHHRWCRDRDLGSGIMSSEAIKEKIERENG